jgi:hypothetical protein
VTLEVRSSRTNFGEATGFPLTIAVPTDFDCPNRRWTGEFVAVTFSNVRVVVNSIPLAIGGTFTFP